jgi:hypothetical protein
MEGLENVVILGVVVTGQVMRHLEEAQRLLELGGLWDIVFHEAPQLTIPECMVQPYGFVFLERVKHASNSYLPFKPSLG